MKEPILSREEVEALAHRICARYIHSENIHLCQYTFGITTLERFAQAYEAALLEKLCGEPIGYMHVLHMEGGQTQTRLTEDAEDHFGVPGEDYDETYTVTTDPVYALSRSKA
ncbi:hypothetical protein [Burkholderia vietnamiensis]|uniref:hypothetical protein n=1 Tax=Burkholderia vietnamiensis TaxID=60552 RepID=UPI001CF2ECC6|nr:hypothetical protein [Burkholderia vietnamiensis]MCA7943281.1 hypothetical protein [Burkholderia vietnamiensis]